MGIIIKPIVTEKQTAITEKFPNRYGFRVSPDANKLEIKKAVEDMYSVTVVDVNTINYSGKRKSRYTKSGIINGKQAAFKKAIVTLKEGETIDFFSNNLKREMGIRKLKPTTPGQRHKVIGAFDKITASTPEKSLVVGKKSTGGRNNTGKMTMRYIGGGHKQKYRIIDFKRNKDGIPATVKSIEYDPNRSSRIALLYYADGAKSYIIAPNGLEVGQTVVSGSDAAPEVGNTLPMANIPVGTIIHNIELRPGQGAKMVRSAGAFAQLTSKEGAMRLLRCLLVKLERFLRLVRLQLAQLAIQTMLLKNQVRPVALDG